MPSDLPPHSQYLLLRISPPVEELALRQALQENIAQSFGITASGTHLDVLWVDSKPTEKDPGTGRALIRVDHGYARVFHPVRHLNSAQGRRDARSRVDRRIIFFPATGAHQGVCLPPFVAGG